MAGLTTVLAGASEDESAAVLFTLLFQALQKEQRERRDLRPTTHSMSVFAVFLQTVCPALLPPANAEGEENEYYAVLGLPKYSSSASVRSAYKKKSLQLHPDKLAQRGEVVDAKAYERVQQANAVLSDPTKRSLYHSYGCSVARYQFVENGLFQNPMAVISNLQAASISDKSRLFALTVVGVFLLALLQPILIAVKANGDKLKSVSWLWILTPLFIVQGLYMLLLAIMAVFTLQKRKKKKERSDDGEQGDATDEDEEPDDDEGLDTNSALSMLVTLLEKASWLTGTVLLALQWDDAGDDDQFDWNLVAIPFYVGLVMRILSNLLISAKIRKACDTMVSTYYLQRVHDVSPDDELPADLASKYIVVRADELSVAAILAQLNADKDDEDEGVTEDELEEIRVQSSPEFQSLATAIADLRSDVTTLLVVWVTLVVLVSLKLDQATKKDYSWWLIFLPVWLRLGLPWLQAFGFCCCAPPPPIDEIVAEHADDIVIEHSAPTPKAENRREEASVEFEHAEGEMTDNATNSERAVNKQETTDSTEPAVPVAARPSPDSITSKAEEGVTTGAATKEEASAEPISQGAAAAAASADPEQDDDEEGDDDEGFRRWQERMQEEEGAAYMEEKSKALSSCCWFSVQIVMLCLVVALLEDPGAFNALWVLFPIFLGSGILLCCCFCCIYARAPPEMDLGDEEGAQRDEEAPAAAANPAEEEDVPMAQEVEEEASEPAEPAAAATPADVEQGGDHTETSIEDLD